MSAKLPKDERIWVSFRGENGSPVFLITSKPSREQYILYEITPDGVNRLGKSPSPAELAEKFGVYERIGTTD